MLKDLNEDQLQLEELMSRISEEAVSAGWMDGLEYELWEILIGLRTSYYRRIVTQEEIEQLRFLSNKCGCWIIFDDESEETALDLDTWKKRYIEKMGPARGK
jgi:hypothetical protein